jgi:hypothetical protein
MTAAGTPAMSPWPITIKLSGMPETIDFDPGMPSTETSSPTRSAVPTSPSFSIRSAGNRVLPVSGQDSCRETVDSDFDHRGSERDAVASLEREDFSCFVRGCD